MTDAEMKKLISMEIVVFDLDKLKYAEYNPRKSNKLQERHLIDSITRHGFREPLVINMHHKRKHRIIGGNLRVKVCRAMGFTQLPGVVVKIGDIDQEKELNVRLNANTGSWDEELLFGNYAKEVLNDMGFDPVALRAYWDKYEKRIENTSTDDAAYPIVPKLSEKYNYVVIVAENEIDLAYLENFFKLEREQSYKTTRIGIGRAIRFDKFKMIMENHGIGKTGDK